MASKPSILLFSEDFPPNYGGIGQWAIGVAQSIHRMGYPLHLLTRYMNPEAEMLQNREPYPVIQVHGKRWSQFRSFYTYSAIKNIYKKGIKPDIVIATTWNIARGITRILKKNKTKLVIVVHGLEVTRTMPWLKTRWLQQTLNAADAVIAVSNFTRDRVIERCNINPSKVHFLPNGVDPQRFFPRSNTTHLQEKYNLHNKKVILTLARLQERKGHDKVIEALPTVLKEIPNAHYLISGALKGTYYKTLQQQVSNLRLNEHVTFTGFVDSADLNAFYNVCDVYIMPSRELEKKGDTEGFGITFLEANACEKAVIGGRSGGVADAIDDGKTGYLVNPLDSNEIAEKLIYLLSNPELATQFGKQGRQRILTSYTWDAVTKKLLATIA
uniref:Uncharacterized protein n=1 Tax=Chlorobium chlorochromatii (strain CaD3) TaxID=340177 RepID=Q3AQJ6_CHLCH